MSASKHSKRPVYISLTQFRFPVTAIVSVLHRISGVVMFFFMPWILYLFDQSLRSAAIFNALQHSLSSFWSFLFLWAFLSALCFHILAGVRHLTMDFGFGESFEVASVTAWLVLILAIIMVGVTGVWLW